MALAPATVQRMPARLSRAPICLHPASTTPESRRDPRTPRSTDAAGPMPRTPACLPGRVDAGRGGSVGTPGMHTPERTSPNTSVAVRRQSAAPTSIPWIRLRPREPLALMEVLSISMPGSRAFVRTSTLRFRAPPVRCGQQRILAALIAGETDPARRRRHNHDSGRENHRKHWSDPVYRRSVIGLRRPVVPSGSARAA